MSIYLYIFIMTISILFTMFVAINACLKSHDKILDAIEKVKQTKTSDTNELYWKPSEEQMDSLHNAIVRCKGYSDTDHLPELYEDLKKL